MSMMPLEFAAAHQSSCITSDIQFRALGDAITNADPNVLGCPGWLALNSWSTRRTLFVDPLSYQSRSAPSSNDNATTFSGSDDPSICDSIHCVAQYSGITL